MFAILNKSISGDEKFDINLSPFDMSKVTKFDAKLGNWEFVPTRTIEWYKHKGINRDQIVLFYNAVYFSIEELEITKSVGVKDIFFTMWNAFFHDVTLTDVQIPHGSGITFSAPDGYHLKSLELKTFKFFVTKGSENLNDFITFRFSNGYVFKLKLIVVSTQYLLMQPEKTIEETLIYKTEISQSLRKELRAKLAQSPLYKLKYKYILTENQLPQIVNDFQAHATETYVVPLWLHIYETKEKLFQVGTQSVQLTRNPEHIRVNDYVVMTDGHTSQTVLVQNIINDVIFLKAGLNFQFDAQCFIIPCRNSAALDGVSLSRELNGVFKMTVEYTFKNHNVGFKNIDLPMLNGYPVLTLPYYDGSMTNQQDVKIIQDTAAFPFVHINKERGLFTSNVESDVNRETYFKWLDFINYCSGRFKSFWLPTRTRDFTLATEAIIHNSFISIESGFDLKVGYGLAITVEGKTEYYIIRDINQDGGFRNIILDRELTKTIKTTDKYKISLLLRCRLNDDEISITHSDYYNKTISLNTIEVL